MGIDKFVYNVRLEKNKKLPQLGPSAIINSHRHRAQNARSLGSVTDSNTLQGKSQDQDEISRQFRSNPTFEDFESTLSQEDLDDIEAEVDRRMIDKDEQITALNNQIAELSSQRDELMQNEKENRAEITKLNNRISILEDKIKRRRKRM